MCLHATPVYWTEARLRRRRALYAIAATTLLLAAVIAYSEYLGI